MRTLGWTIATAAVLAILGLTSPSLLADGDTEHHVKLKLALDGSDSADFVLDNLAVGETRTFTTAEGKPVTATRTETGYDIDVNGKKIHIAGPGSEEHGLQLHSGDGKKIIVRSGAGENAGQEKNISVVIAGDGDASATVSSGEPQVRIHKVQRIHGGDGEAEAEVIVRALGADGQEIELENLAAGQSKKIVIHRAGAEDQVIDLGDEGQAHVVVIKKLIEGCEGEAAECEHVEVRVEKRSNDDAEQDDDEN